jgi:hypothetical protein
VHSIYGGEGDEQQATASEARKLLADVTTFWTSSIAPLQTILAGIPQLKERGRVVPYAIDFVLSNAY